MKTNIGNRLNQILPLIKDEAFLSNEGIGNEIACYIFDYSPQDELLVREHIQLMLKDLAKNHDVLHLNLFDVVIEYLKDRGLFDKVPKLFKKKGDKALLSALKGPMAPEKISEFIKKKYAPADHDLLLLSGVGSAWPMLRAHGLLNCLHAVIGQTPLVMFYPGSFDGTTLNLFNLTNDSPKPGSKSYYRAFILVPGGTSA